MPAFMVCFFHGLGPLRSGQQGFSWASVDFNGHWRLLHYAIREVFQPLLVSGA